MGFLDDVEHTVSNLGHDVESSVGKAYRGAIQHALGSGKSGFGLLAKNFGITPGRFGVHPVHRAPVIPSLAPHPTVPLLQAKELVGMSTGQEYAYSGGAIVAAGTAVTAGYLLVDMFSSTNTPQFSASYQFPQPFQAKSISISFSTSAAAGAKDDRSWLQALQLAWWLNTEVTRSSILSYRPNIDQTDGTGTGQAMERVSTAFNAYFRGGSINYQPRIYAQVAANPTTVALGVSWVLDGWTIQGGETDVNDIREAVANLLGTTHEEAMSELRAGLIASGRPVLF